MVNLIGTLAMSLAALLPAPAQKEAVKPPLDNGGALVIKIMPHKSVTADGDYAIEGEESKESASTADSRYSERKAALDERFAYMFELKDALEKAQSEMSKKWEEYYALHDKYNRELKRIVSAWVADSYYESDASAAPAPQPRRSDGRVVRPIPHRFENDTPIGEHVPYTLEEK